MRRLCLIIILLFALFSAAIAQLYREPPFGLNLPFDRWSRDVEIYQLNIPAFQAMFGPVDAANLRIASDNDTTDVILLADRGNSRIYWLRTEAGEGPRSIIRRAYFGEFGSETGQFGAPCAIEVASVSEVYNPPTDHIFIADRINNRLVKLNYEFYPNSPQLDSLVWESAEVVDSNFFAVDLEYINFQTGDSQDNVLLALDDISGRLAVFSHEGSLTGIFNLRNVDDTTHSIYTGMTYRVISERAAIIYVADIANSRIRGFLYNHNSITHIADLIIDSGPGSRLCNVVFGDRIGLWAIESSGPHLYKLSRDLSSIIREIGPEDLDRVEMHYPVAIVIFPERLVVFEEMDENSGILTFSFESPSGKRNVKQQDEILPEKLTLSQNYPNPFNPSTTIKFGLPKETLLQLEIFDILGRSVRKLFDGKLNSGFHEIIWDSRNRAGLEVASGVYFYRLETSENVLVKRMLLLK